ncbi:MAG: class I SAM-dependent rRNA methyltransferase [bacterium]|nr:class I SAM-dependent rRNA methyltransferase [Planctomycetota bacterium]HIL51229.1 class I SAM-dependent rRNA methyltransferase [Planctomycetota bacterium]
MGKATLSGKGRRWVLGGHPWIYRDDIAGGEAESGELIQVEDPAGNSLGWGLFSSTSKIALRLVTRQPVQPKREFWLERVQRAVQARERMGFLNPRGACRLIAADADRIPGWIVDLYGTTAVVQSSIQGSDRMRDFLVELLEAALPFKLDCIVDRSDSSVRRFEDLDSRVEILKGQVTEGLEVHEDDLVYEVDVLNGHKTGHYLDQRLNRQLAAREAQGKRVLDAFCYDGLFGVRAAMAGAEDVLCLDQSGPAGERVLRNAERNGVAHKLRFEKANCMQALRNLKSEGHSFDIAIVDPPAFARNRREISGAERGYVELNRRALALLEAGGLLVSASCSYNVRASAFVKFLASAGRLAERDVWLEELRGASPDHPQLLAVPETAYLKCAFLRAL